VASACVIAQWVQSGSNMLFTIALYVLAFIGLVLSLVKNRQKTRMALQKSWKAFESMLPQMLVILVLIGFMLAMMDAKIIAALIGESSGGTGLLVAGAAGSITLIPGFVAFPLAGALLETGAGLAPVVAFLSTLMMVGIVTLPAEIRVFGKKAALLRNGLAFLLSLLIAVAMSWLLGVIA